MLNLLIISDNSKAFIMLDRLQPMLSLKIDIISDFDQGLKEVLEKRPATVIIQDEIGGVSSENVIRHVRMLLGSGSPSFILLHQGGKAVSPVKGLYEYVADLSLPAAAFFEKLLSSLKEIYSSRWDKVYIKPVADEVALMPQAELSHQHESEKLVDELFSELSDELDLADADSGNASPVKVKNEPELVHLATKTEEIAALLVEAAKEAREDKPVANSLPSADSHQSAGHEKSQPVLHDNSRGEKVNTDRVDSRVARSATAIPAAESNPSKGGFKQPAGEQGPFQSGQSQVADDILVSFEKNYRADSSSLKTVLLIALAIAAVLAASWYLFGQNTDLLSIFQKKQTQPAVTAPKAVSAPVTPVQKPVSSSPKPLSKVADTLPSFIPAGSRDNGFIGKGPGWERYLTSSHDFRLFRTNGRIRAVQVLSAGNRPIGDAFLKSALQELAGGIELKIVTSQKKQELLQQRYIVNGRAELLTYRNRTSKDLLAFVLSID
jgi:hypothetical protein